jgi:hypothetical protein
MLRVPAFRYLGVPDVDDHALRFLPETAREPLFQCSHCRPGVCYEIEASSALESVFGAHLYNPVATNSGALCCWERCTTSSGYCVSTASRPTPGKHTHQSGSGAAAFRRRHRPDCIRSKIRAIGSEQLATSTSIARALLPRSTRSSEIAERQCSACQAISATSVLQRGTSAHDSTLAERCPCGSHSTEGAWATAVLHPGQQL